METHPNRSLLAWGALLVLLGLIVGILIPAFANPRMALSSHQVGLLAGILMLVLGLAWPYAQLSPTRSKVVHRLVVVGPYVIWASTVLAALLGTSRATPIAGAGFSGARWAELLVTVALALGSAASVVALGLLVRGFVRSREPRGQV